MLSENITIINEYLGSQRNASERGSEYGHFLTTDVSADSV